MSERHFDIAIVGGGLAGSCMALTLLLKGHSVLLMDDPGLSQSSRVAAGIYNPVVFKRTTLAWRTREMLKVCREFYLQAETLTGKRFHYQVPFYRFFSDYEEQNEWMARSGQELYRPYLSDQLLTAQPPFVSPYGMAMVQEAGWLDTRIFIEAVRERLVSPEGHWLQQRFIPSALQKTGNGRFGYQDLTFDKVVFCEGHLLTSNPWFGFVRLFPVKGEVLELETEELPANRIYNGAAYMLVMPGGRVRLGSTYDWENLDDRPTVRGKQELLEKLEGFYTGAKTVVGHGAGVRPAGHDRRPVLGEHPTHKNMYVLNGLGAKGVSLGPWCARHLYACMYQGVETDKEVSLQRYLK